MKRLLSLVLVVVLVLVIASFASAAGTITWGGNMRVWFMDVQGPSDSLTSYEFDRIELSFKDALSDHDGISALYQWRDYASGGTLTARLDSGYYYYDGLIAKGDELQVGALDKLPFRLGLSKNSNFVDTGLGSTLKVANCVGISYTLAAPTFTVGAGFADANLKDISNEPAKSEGYCYSIRLDAGKNFFGLVPGLRLGAGINRSPTTYSSATNVNANENYTTNNVVDVAYVQDLFWVSLESATSTPTVSGDDGDTLSGAYFEAGVNIGKYKIWAGRISNDEEYPIYSYSDKLIGSGIISKTNPIHDGTIVAGIIPVSANSEIQVQYIMGDDWKDQETGKELDVRYRVNF